MIASFNQRGLFPVCISGDPAQAVVITDHSGSAILTGETVSLSCDIRKGSGWRYSWIKKTLGNFESLTASSTESQQNLTLQFVTESDSGEYWCQGERGHTPTIQSLPGSLTLKVSAVSG